LSSRFALVRLPSTTLIALLLIVCLSAVIIAGNRELIFRTEVFEGTDFNVNALQVERAKHLQEWYGNYSRFHFNHPGPAFFYLYALGERWLHDQWAWVPSPYNAHLIIGVCAQVAFFTLSLLLLADVFGRRRVIPLGLVIGAIHFAIAPHMFISIWPPEVLVMPFLAFFAACLGLALGHIRHLPWVVLSGSFLVHGHVTQPLFVITLFVMAYVLAWRRTSRSASAGTRPLLPVRAHPLAHLISAAVLAIFILPILRDLTLGSESNFSAILRHLRTTTPNDHKTIVQSILFFLSFITYSLRTDALLESASFTTFWQIIRQQPVAFLLWLASVIGLVVMSVTKRSVAPTLKAPVRTAALLLAVTISLCVVWGLMVTGPMFAFNGHFYFGVHFLIYLVAAVALAEQMPQRMLRWALIPSLLLVGVVSFRGIRHEPSYADPRSIALRDAALAALEKDPNRTLPKMLVFDGEHWSQAASVALALRRAGVDFRVSPAWQFMFQARYTIKESELEAETFPFSTWRFVNEPRVAATAPLNEHLTIAFGPASLPPAGGRIRFDVEGEMYHYLLSGVSAPVVGDGAWTDHSHAVFQFRPEPSEHGVLIHIRAYPFLVRGQIPLQPTEMYFNEHLLFSSPFTEPGVLRVHVPVHLWNARPVATIRLHLSNANAPAELGLWGDTRHLALALQELTTERPPD
jgi:MFS family permease